MFTAFVEVDFDWSNFIMGYRAPWWSTFAGIGLGGLIAYITSNVLEQRRLTSAREARTEDRHEAARKHAIDTVAMFDAQVESVRLRYLDAHHRWGLEFPKYVDNSETDEEDAEWPPEVATAYTSLRLEGNDDVIAASASYAQIRMLPSTDLDSAAFDVWNAVSELKPRNGYVQHVAAVDTLSDARQVLHAVTKNLFHADLLDLPDRNDLYRAIKADVQGMRLVVGDEVGVKNIYVPDGTDSTILNLRDADALQVQRGSQYVANDYLESGMSTAVFVIELNDGSMDFYAIALATEGDPVTNVPGWPPGSVAGDSLEDVEPGTVVGFTMLEDGRTVRSTTRRLRGEVFATSSEELPGQAFGISSEPLIPDQPSRMHKIRERLKRARG